MNSDRNIDLNKLVNNFRDLNQVADYLYQNINQKNQILKAELQECTGCQAQLHRLKRSIK